MGSMTPERIAELWALCDRRYDACRDPSLLAACTAALDEVERLRAEIEDWRGRLATQCGQTLAARKQRDDASAEVERLRAENTERLDDPVRMISQRLSSETAEAVLQRAIFEAVVKKHEGTPMTRPGRGQCHDCGRPYGDKYGFPDLVIPRDAWRRISPTGGDGGLLCPSCICARLHVANIRCEGAFMSGPILPPATTARLRAPEDALDGCESCMNQNEHYDSESGANRFKG